MKVFDRSARSGHWRPYEHHAPLPLEGCTLRNHRSLFVHEFVKMAQTAYTMAEQGMTINQFLHALLNSHALVAAEMETFGIAGDHKPWQLSAAQRCNAVFCKLLELLFCNSKDRMVYFPGPAQPFNIMIPMLKTIAISYTTNQVMNSLSPVVPGILCTVRAFVSKLRSKA